MISSKERSIIRDMCAIASAQGMDHTGKRGEGDYQSWTLATFEAADRLLIKMQEPDPAFELLRVLKATTLFLEMFYDSSEDNRTNPIQQSLGRTMQVAQRVIAKHTLPGKKEDNQSK